MRDSRRAQWQGPCLESPSKALTDECLPVMCRALGSHSNAIEISEDCVTIWEAPTDGQETANG